MGLGGNDPPLGETATGAKSSLRDQKDAVSLVGKQQIAENNDAFDQGRTALVAFARSHHRRRRHQHQDNRNKGISLADCLSGSQALPHSNPAPLPLPQLCLFNHARPLLEPSTLPTLSQSTRESPNAQKCAGLQWLACGHQATAQLQLTQVSRWGGAHTGLGPCPLGPRGGQSIAPSPVCQQSMHKTANTPSANNCPTQRGQHARARCT